MNKYYKFDDESSIKESSEKKIRSIKCKVCGALVDGKLWEEFGECPICLDRKMRKGKEDQTKIEAKEVIEENIEEEQEGIPLVPLAVGSGVFLGLVKLIQKLIKR